MGQPMSNTNCCQTCIDAQTSGVLNKINASGATNLKIENGVETSLSKSGIGKAASQDTDSNNERPETA